VDLGTILYLDLHQNPVYGSLTLSPFRSRVLVEAGQLADLALSMAAAGPTATLAGAPVTYTLALENAGLAPAESVVLTHTVPAEIVGTAWESSLGEVALRPGSRYVWDLPELAAGAGAVITVSGTFTATLAEGTPILLQAVAATLAPESELSNNRAFLCLGGWTVVYLPLVGR
jgi:uncharacterized repeat protein (TIGR01451 family)